LLIGLFQALATYFATFLSFKDRLSRYKGWAFAPKELGITNFPSIFLVFYFLGLSGRFSEILLPKNFYFPLVQNFATVGAFILIAFWNIGTKRLSILISLIFLGEVSWGLFFVTSKFYIFLPFISLFIRSKVFGSNGLPVDKNAGRKFKKYMSTILLLIILILLFQFVQSSKGIRTAEISQQVLVESYSQGMKAKAISTLVSVAERFDGESAAGDAYFAGIGSWRTPLDYFFSFIKNLIPKQLVSKSSTSIGQQWTQEVRSRTIPNQYQQVSLAAGPGAEGYLIFGFVGAFLVSLLCGYFTVLTCSLRKNRFDISIVFAIAIISNNNALFEDGLISWASSIDKGIQSVGLYLILKLIFSRKIRVSPEAPEISSIGTVV
jgi:hypothetical protein